ncbi:hypothetical protein Droror1_Dr00026899 [Drosera rotundifolia]
MKGVKLRDLYILVGSTVGRDGTAAILTEDTDAPNSAALEATVSGAPVLRLQPSRLRAPRVLVLSIRQFDAPVGGSMEKVVDEAPGTTQAKGINAKLWHYRLGHVSERGMKGKGFSKHPVNRWWLEALRKNGKLDHGPC